MDLFRLLKDIVHKAADQLAVVGVIRDPDVVLPGVHAKLQIGLTQAPSGGSVVLQNKSFRVNVAARIERQLCSFFLPAFSEDMMA